MGDLGPILRIGNILQAAGDSVTLVTHAGYDQVVQQAGLAFVASDTQPEFEQYLQGISLCETPRGNIEFQKRFVLPMAEREANLLIEQCASPNTVLVGSHMLMLGPQLAAEKLGLPVVRVFPSAVNVTRLFLFEIMFRDVLSGEINALRNRLSLPDVVDWATFIRQPQCNIGAWPDWFTANEPDWPDWLDLVTPGFLSMDDLKEKPIPDELEQFLQAGDPPVLITGGTGTYLNKGFYAACIEGCLLAGRRGILATRFREAIPDSLPPQIKWFPHLPFVSLMPRLAAIIHHGGMGTLALAIRAGIPQLILAVGADRPDNAERLQRAGIGEYLPLPKWKPELVVKALERLIDSPSVLAACQEHAQQLRASDPALVVRTALAGLAPG
jgi:UDP:flavonoid glycosyltransferase YjiC (YdhE family)